MKENQKTLYRDVALYFKEYRKDPAGLHAYLHVQEAGTAPAVDKLDVTVGEVFDGWAAREYRKLKPASIASLGQEAQGRAE